MVGFGFVPLRMVSGQRQNSLRHTVQDKNQLLDRYLISLTEVHVSDPVQLLELKRNTESIAVWTKKLSEKKVCCNKLLFSCITNHIHFKAISLILDTCQKLVCLIAINRSYVYPSDKKSAHW